MGSSKNQRELYRPRAPAGVGKDFKEGTCPLPWKSCKAFCALEVSRTLSRPIISTLFSQFLEGRSASTEKIPATPMNLPTPGKNPAGVHELGMSHGRRNPALCGSIFILIHPPPLIFTEEGVKKCAFRHHSPSSRPFRNGAIYLKSETNLASIDDASFSFQV